jgi:hypothetical protein
VYVPVPDYVTVRRNRKNRTSLYIKQKMLILGRVATVFISLPLTALYSTYSTVHHCFIRIPMNTHS